MAYNQKYIVETCSVSGNPIKVVLSKREASVSEVAPIAIGLVNFTLKYKDVDENVTNQINGSSLDLTIFSQEGLSIQNLYTEDEREWKTEVYLNENLYWSGFNLPEGYSQPYSHSNYEIKIRAVDTLETLKKQPYASDLGVIYLGFETDIKIIAKALAKTGLELSIGVLSNVFEAQMNQSLDPLSQTSLNQNRFLDKSNKPIDCYEVIKSCLNRLSAKLHQVDGRWVIVNALENSLVTKSGWLFNSSGDLVSSYSVSSTITAGGALDQAAVLDTDHTLSLSQAFKNAIGYYQYGYPTNKLVNGNFNEVLPIPYLQRFPGWEALNSVNIGVVDETTTVGGTVTVIGHALAIYNGNSATGKIVRTEDQIQVRANEKVIISMDFSVYGSLTGSLEGYSLHLVINDTIGNRFYTQDKGWKNTGNVFTVPLRRNSIRRNKINSITVEVSPQETDYQFKLGLVGVFRLVTIGSNDFKETHFDNVNITTEVADVVLTPAIGEFTKITQFKTLTKTDDALVTLHGDDVDPFRTSPILINGTSPSSAWSRKGFGLSDNKELTFLMADTRLRLNSRPKYIFDGKISTKLKVTPLTLFTIVQQPGNYLFLSGEFDLLNEEYKLILFEALTESIAYNLVEALDYGNFKDGRDSGVSQIVGVNIPAQPGQTAGQTVNDIASKATKAEVEAQTDDTKYITPLRIKDWWTYIRAFTIAFTNQVTFTTYKPTFDDVQLATVDDIASKATIAEAIIGTNDTKYITPLVNAYFTDQQLLKASDVKHNSVQNTGTFVSGFTGSGWKVGNDATFDNLTVRQAFNVYELIINKIRATNGSLAITDSAKLSNVVDIGTAYDCYIETDGGFIAIPFAINDLVRCQVFNGQSSKYYLGTVTNVYADRFTINKASKVGSGIPEIGDAVVRFGNTTDTARQGLIYITSSETNSPYLDVLDGITSSSLTNKTKVRLGRLDGIVDADLGTLSDYGLYATNVYLKGKIVATSGLIGGIEIASNSISSSNGKFSVTSAGVLSAVDAVITGTYKSAVSGKMVVINGNDNNITIKDALGAALISMDDDSGFLGDPGITVYSPAYSISAKLSGRGISIGYSELRSERLFMAGSIYMYPNPGTGAATGIEIYDGITTHVGKTWQSTFRDTDSQAWVLGWTNGVLTKKTAISG